MPEKSSARSEFMILVFLIFATRFSDLFVTFRYSPDLALEANPVVTYFKLHWLEFILFSICLTISVILCLYYDLFYKNTKYPREQALPFSEFAPLHWFGRKRHPIFFLLAFAKDGDLRIKYIGYAGSRLLILIGLIATLSWVGLAESRVFERIYGVCFPVFPYGVIVIGAVFLLYRFLKREFVIYLGENQFKKVL